MPAPSTLQSFPTMVKIRQRFPESKAVPIDVAVAEAWLRGRGQTRVRAGARIAVAVGSRGITQLEAVVRAVVAQLKAAGAHPFIVPAMGSHGGATPEGQTELLAEYGITSSALGVPIEASMDAEELGRTQEGYPVFFSSVARGADGLVVVNRVKPHTDFTGELGSGLLKMLVVGLGKRAGASAFHRAANRIGFEHVLRTASKMILQAAPVLGGFALVENYAHQTARIEFLPPEQFESGEERLFQEAKRLMPRLPFKEVDLLIVDWLGKNISGAGMDPNVIGRSVHGYSSLLRDRARDEPAVMRLFVRDLTPESHGNATGIGMADFTTTRLVRAIDRRIATINTLTAMTPQGVKIPIHFDTDREVLEQAFDTLALPSWSAARVMRIRDTLNLEEAQVSEAYVEELSRRSDLEIAGEMEPIRFDARGDLAPL